MLRCAILDDYQGVARDFADWTELEREMEIVTFRAPLGDRRAVVTALAGFDIVVAMRERTRFDAETLAGLPDLRLLVTTGLKNAAIDARAAAAHGITVCGTPGDHNSTVELTWALILALLRNIPREYESMRGGGWQVSVGRSLRGRRLGVLGLGNIGTKVAAIGRAFGMDVLAWSPNLTAARCDEAGVALAPSLEALCAQADVLSLHLALSDRTRGIISGAHLRALGPDACLINAARAELIDEAALMLALQERWFAGAALDVFHQEPLPAGHPLRRMGHVLTTPHIGYVADRGYRRYFTGVVDSITAWRRGAPIHVIASPGR